MISIALASVLRVQSDSFRISLVQSILGTASSNGTQTKTGTSMTWQKISAVCINNIATKKTITWHSRPWINSDIPNQLKHRKQRKNCRLRRSARNTERLSELQKETVDMISNAEHEWWLSECGKRSSASEREKWKIINTFTNQSNESQVQPICKVENGKASYLFSDNDIIRELENHHILKNPHSSAGSRTQISANITHYNYSRTCSWMQRLLIMKLASFKKRN